MHFCTQITRQGGKATEEKSWCGLTDGSAYTFADACDKFLEDLGYIKWVEIAEILRRGCS